MTSSNLLPEPRTGFMAEVKISFRKEKQVKIIIEKIVSTDL